jgi:6-phosphogluconolactonase (cycloisomerase 2 family)
VTDRNGANIDVFMVLGDGRTSGPTITPTPITDTFGFLFDSNGFLVVTLGNNGAFPGAVSSYQILGNGTTEVITQSLVTGTQLGPCWCAITANDKYIFTVNTASSTITALGFDSGTGTLTLLNPVGGGGLAGLLPAGTAPTDIAIYGNSFLYVNVDGSGQIAAFTIEKGGSLDELFLGPAGVLPKSAGGLVVR